MDLAEAAKGAVQAPVQDVELYLVQHLQCLR